MGVLLSSAAIGLLRCQWNEHLACIVLPYSSFTNKVDLYGFGIKLLLQKQVP